VLVDGGEYAGLNIGIGSKIQYLVGSFHGAPPYLSTHFSCSHFHLEGGGAAMEAINNFVLGVMQ
jgi:hypothetical protein